MWITFWAKYYTEFWKLPQTIFLISAIVCILSYMVMQITDKTSVIQDTGWNDTKTEQNGYIWPFKKWIYNISPIFNID